MAKTLDVKYESKHCYNIEIRPDFNDLGTSINDLGLDAKRVMIVTDDNVGKLYSEKVKTVISDTASKPEVHVFTLKAGEESKTLANIQNIYEALVINHFDRKDILIALGGGVVGDMTGFAAATYMRGIDFIQIPTSLLSQVDSSIGGKTGVDFLSYKNMVGAFHMPRLVYINTNVLKTLPKEQFICGMGEIIKHGLIKNNDYYNWLKDNSKAVMSLDDNALEYMIYESCKIKRDVVERDPKEMGERALLNFGHTIGHSIEKNSNFNLYHGQCVGIGAVAAAFISMKYGSLTEEEYKDIRETLELYEMPLYDTTKDTDANTIYDYTLSDKKRAGNSIKFILLHSIGDAYIEKGLSKENILAGIKEIIK
ncbi:MAG: 3-dehydroquinate synthase [Lachnospiraceae bacterium]|nr:3-dehydroquinate synthase [Lachnospiraceae bacterium]